MRMRGRMMMVTALAIGLAACGSPPEDQAASDAPAAATAAAAADTTAAAPAGGKPAAFAQCAACHSVEPGKNGIGPSLAGVFGKKAGGVAGFAYSDALKSHGGNWDWKNLSDWLHNPKAFAAGTKVTFSGLSSGEDRANLIAYLNTQG